MKQKSSAKIKQISPCVYQIDLGSVNSFVIENQGKLALVDTGYEGDQHKIYDALQQINKKPTDVAFIILTHLHPDHAGAASAIQQDLCVPIWVTNEDGTLLKQGISLRDNMQTSSGLLNKILKFLFVKEIKSVPPIASFEPLSDGQVIPFGEGILTLFTPGHSKGHISLLVQSDKVLIAGDICANNVDLTPSIVYEDIATGNATLKKICKEHDFEAICFGHGKPILKDARQKFCAKFQ